ncbi:MAG: hypothetical protein LUD50_07585 [Clostridia bacterium]|nr:hypothetical protein [Clostridia bacterium]
MTEEEFIEVVKRYYTRSAEKIQAEVDMCKTIAKDHGISAEDVFESRAIFIMNPNTILPRDDDM